MMKNKILIANIFFCLFLFCYCQNNNINNDLIYKSLDITNISLDDVKTQTKLTESNIITYITILPELATVSEQVPIVIMQFTDKEKAFMIFKKYNIDKISLLFIKAKIQVGVAMLHDLKFNIYGLPTVLRLTDDELKYIKLYEKQIALANKLFYAIVSNAQK
jgi:hypothetical protein